MKSNPAEGAGQIPEIRGSDQRMKLVVDFNKCSSHGVCMGVAPELFEVRDDNFLYILQEEPPEEMRSKAESAAAVCPTGAISIEG